MADEPQPTLGDGGGLDGFGANPPPADDGEDGAELDGEEMSEPDYDRLAWDGEWSDDGEGGGEDEAGEDAGRIRSDDGCGGVDDGDGEGTDEDDPPSSPDYDRLLLGFDDLGGGTEYDDPPDGLREGEGIGAEGEAGGAQEEDEDEEEEYILGTLMVRVLQAKDLKSDPRDGGGGLLGLLTKHRRLRRDRSAMSPLSGGGGALTPSSHYGSNHQHLYAALSYGDQVRSTVEAREPLHGDYHWPRGEQSCFDVTCPRFPTEGRTGRDAGKGGGAENLGDGRGAGGCRRPPTLCMSLYSGRGGKRLDKHQPSKGGKTDDDDLLLGSCRVDVRRVLSGRTPYLDEWCALRGGADGRDGDGGGAGRVRVAIEYEPSDPPPRPGDTCAFAGAVGDVGRELYPVPLWSVRDAVKPSRSSATLSTASTASLSSSASMPPVTSPGPSVSVRPHTYRVEEILGDRVVLSYRTPDEGWDCTFEAHRYLLLTVERHRAVVERYREAALDLCDNLVQSPAADAMVKAVESVPEEGLVYVGADLAEGGARTIARWWEGGSPGAAFEELFLDGINLDGRHTRYQEEEEEEREVGLRSRNTEQSRCAERSEYETDIDDGASAGKAPPPPGMPCCPITGQPMSDPVVAADGHTYEREAIARWLRESDRSPLTGETLAHAELVPNYLLLSGL